MPASTRRSGTAAGISISSDCLRRRDGVLLCLLRRCIGIRIGRIDTAAHSARRATDTHHAIGPKETMLVQRPHGQVKGESKMRELAKSAHQPLIPGTVEY